MVALDTPLLYVGTLGGFPFEHLEGRILLLEPRQPILLHRFGWCFPAYPRK